MKCRKEIGICNRALTHDSILFLILFRQQKLSILNGFLIKISLRDLYHSSRFFTHKSLLHHTVNTCTKSMCFQENWAKKPKIVCRTEQFILNWNFSFENAKIDPAGHDCNLNEDKEQYQCMSNTVIWLYIAKALLYKFSILQWLSTTEPWRSKNFHLLYILSTLQTKLLLIFFFSFFQCN